MDPDPDTSSASLPASLITGRFTQFVAKTLRVPHDVLPALFMSLGCFLDAVSDAIFLISFMSTWSGYRFSMALANPWAIRTTDVTIDAREQNELTRVFTVKRENSWSNNGGDSEPFSLHTIYCDEQNQDVCDNLVIVTKEYQGQESTMSFQYAKILLNCFGGEGNHQARKYDVK